MVNFVVILKYITVPFVFKSVSMAESKPGWPFGLHIWFVGRDRVGERAHLPVDLDTDEGIDKVQLTWKYKKVQFDKKIFTWTQIEGGNSSPCSAEGSRGQNLN